MIERIEWLGHASFRIQGSPLIYIDPWRVARNAPCANIILITHDHYDHCSPPDVEKLRGPNTVILANSMAGAVLEKVSRFCAPGRSITLTGPASKPSRHTTAIILRTSRGWDL